MSPPCWPPPAGGCGGVRCPAGSGAAPVPSLPESHCSAAAPASWNASSGVSKMRRLRGWARAGVGGLEQAGAPHQRHLATRVMPTTRHEATMQPRAPPCSASASQRCRHQRTRPSAQRTSRRRWRSAGRRRRATTLRRAGSLSWGCASRFHKLHRTRRADRVGINPGSDQGTVRSDMLTMLTTEHVACTCILLVHIVDHSRSFIVPKLQLQEPRHRARDSSALKPPHNCEHKRSMEIADVSAVNGLYPIAALLAKRHVAQRNGACAG